MSTNQILRIVSTSSDDTERLGEQIAKQLKGGECIELASDLGGGKTTFVRGFVRGAGSNDKVASPTFTISKVYKTHSFEIHHFDFYRLASPGLAAYELQDLLGDPEIVTVIEWGDVMGDSLPADRVTIQIQRAGDNEREITVSCPTALSYLLQELRSE